MYLIQNKRWLGFCVIGLFALQLISCTVESDENELYETTQIKNDFQTSADDDALGNQMRPRSGS